MGASFIPPKVPAFYRYSAKLLGASMWFFMFYRMKQDGATTLGFHKPFEGGHHDDHHGEHH